MFKIKTYFVFILISIKLCHLADRGECAETVHIIHKQLRPRNPTQLSPFDIVEEVLPLSSEFV
jgi:hypothetical protein